LIQALLAAKLVDRFTVWTYPVVLGEGKRLFGTGTIPTAMQLLSSDVTSTGVIVASYEPAGTPSRQTFAVADGKEIVQD
jgi:dihydrofolate reductase